MKIIINTTKIEGKNRYEKSMLAGIFRATLTSIRFISQIFTVFPLQYNPFYLFHTKFIITHTFVSINPISQKYCCQELIIQKSSSFNFF